MRKILIFVIRGYQKMVSPFLRRSCRYEPTCSEYAIDALVEYGAARGSALTLWRILRCNPFSKGGYDPVRKTRKN